VWVRFPLPQTTGDSVKAAHETTSFLPLSASNPTQATSDLLGELGCDLVDDGLFMVSDQKFLRGSDEAKPNR